MMVNSCSRDGAGWSVLAKMYYVCVSNCAQRSSLLSPLCVCVCVCVFVVALCVFMRVG